MELYIDKTSTERVCEIEEGTLPDSITKLEDKIRKAKKAIERKEEGSKNQEKEKQTLLAKEGKMDRSIQSFIGWLSNQVVFACDEELTLYIAHGKNENKGSTIDKCQRKFIADIKRKCREYEIELEIEDIDEMPDMEMPSIDELDEFEGAFIPYKQMNVTRYTKEVWFKTNPDSTEEQYEIIASPHNPYHFIANMMEHTPDSAYEDVAEMRLITLGQEYLDWLHENGYENNEKNRIDYVNSISTEEADEIMKKYHFNRVLSLGGFFVSLVSEGYSMIPRKTVFRLEKEDRERITEILEETYGKGNVYVPGIMVKPDVYVLQKDRFEEMALDYFVNGKEPNLNRWMEQKFAPGTNASAVVVPVFLWDELDSCVITVDQFTFESDQTAYYNDELSDEILESKQECTEIGMIIRSCFSNRYEPIIYEALVPIEFVPEMYEYMGEEMMRDSVHLI